MGNSLAKAGDDGDAVQAELRSSIHLEVLLVVRLSSSQNMGQRLSPRSLAALPVLPVLCSKLVIYDYLRPTVEGRF